MPNNPPTPDLPFPANFRALYRDATAIERARLLRRCKHRYEQLYPHARHGGDRQSASYRENSKVKIPQLEFSACPTDGENPSLCSADASPPAFSTVAASHLGCTPRTIQQIVRIAELIPLQLQTLLAATPIADRKAELSQIARMAPELQQKILTGLRTGPAPCSLAALTARP